MTCDDNTHISKLSWSNYCCPLLACSLNCEQIARAQLTVQLPDWADRGMGVSEGIVIAYQQFSMHHWRSKLCLQAFGDQDDITKIIIRFPDLDNVPCSKSSKMSFFQAYVYVWRYEDGGYLAYFSDTILNVAMVKPLNLIEINRWYCRLSLFIKHPLLIIVMVTQQ